MKNLQLSPADIHTIHGALDSKLHELKKDVASRRTTQDKLRVAAAKGTNVATHIDTQQEEIDLNLRLMGFLTSLRARLNALQDEKPKRKPRT